MKKSSIVIALILTFSMLFSMVACQNTGTGNPQTDAPTSESDTEPVTEPVVDPSFGLPEIEDAFELQLDASAEIKTQGAVITIPVSVNVKCAAIDSISLNASASAMGNEMKVDAYFNGETLYFNYNGVLAKIEANELSEALSSVEIPGMDDAEAELPSIDEESMEQLQAFCEAALEIVEKYISTTEEGDSTITKLDLPKEGLVEILHKVSEMAGQELGEDVMAAVDAIDLDNLVCSVTTVDGVFSSMKFNWTINNIEMGDVSSLSIALSMEASLVATGDDVVLTVPDNLDEYLPVDECDFGGEGDDQTSLAILALLYDTETMQPVENYDEVYAQCVETYGQEAVENALKAVRFSALTTNILALYNDDYTKADNYDTVIGELKDSYGEEEVLEAESYVDSVIALLSQMGSDVA